ncbi:unnamed protein product [Adineta steineri]|uniref:Uncharacterized protein n=1 Tax=Adineta steineri TaxID=433720 RepID=A0A818KES5_9BILA|nr:unnamed protein product [Adineta steineri]CAF3550554.1 unnamed protein product [Adineta steineri]
MSNSNYDQSIEPLNSSRKTFRSHSAIQAHRGDVPSKHDEYLIQLQERNRLLKTYQTQRQPKDDSAKKRETGFQLYLNGAHSAPQRRPISITNNATNRFVTPLPSFSNFSFPTPSNTTQQKHSLLPNGRRQWTSSTKTKIKTADGSIIADIDQNSIPNSNPQLPPHSKSLFNNRQFQQVTSKRAVKSAGTPSEALPKSAWGNQVIEIDASQIIANGTNDQVSFGKMAPDNIDQSWMPNWFNKTKITENIQEYESDFEESSSDNDNDDNDNHQILSRVSLSLDDIPSIVKLSISPEQNNDEEKTIQQENSYLSSPVGR